MSDGAALNISQRFEVIHCYKCGIPFAVPVSIRKRWLENGDNFHCPHGHVQHYTESTAQRLEKQLASERKQKEWAQQDARRAKERADMAERQRAAQKGVATRLKNRAKAGVCPCCNRTVKQLADHMKAKHPNWPAGE